ncbi:hypothetical protein C8T65DRAFT_737558 [Cerioporus squamosus]|nr:hypothetical protein C8T65DRAFT_737558 [Cerioporus squamosus]
MEWVQSHMNNLPTGCMSRIEDFSFHASVVADFHKYVSYHREMLKHIALATLLVEMTPSHAELLRCGELLICLELTPIKMLKAQSPGPAHSWFLYYPLVRSAQDKPASPEFASVWNAQVLQSKFVNDTYIQHFGPVYGIFLPKDPDTLSKTLTRDTLNDYMSFFMGCLNCGIVLRPSKNDKAVALPGELHLVKMGSKETWTWWPVPVPWSGVQCTIVYCSGYTPRSGMAPPQLMKFFASL